MLKLYYMIWSDIILTARKNGNFTDKWKELNYVVPIFQGLNLIALEIIIKFIFNIQKPLSFTIDIFPGEKLDSALVGIITIFLPFFLLNYFLIIRNNRYEKIIINYESKNGKLVFRYCIFSVLILILPLVFIKISQ